MADIQVNPLNWKSGQFPASYGKMPDGKCRKFFTAHVLGLEYNVNQIAKDGSWSWRLRCCEPRGNCETAELAKAAAQADYEKRILGLVSLTSPLRDSSTEGDQ